MNYVIIGNSTAAIGCIEGIRQLDAENPITVIASEKYHTYSRPLISYLLQQKTDQDRMLYREKNFYKKNNCTLITGKTAVSINPKAKTVALNDNSTIPYDKLLVATGSRPFTPPMDGLETIAALSFMTLDNALALEKTLKRKPRVLIIGAGLIGMKCAEGIAERAGSVTVVELAPRVLPIVLDQKGSALVQHEMEKHGVSFVLRDSVKQFIAKKDDNLLDGKPMGGTALTTGGKSIDFDVLVTAVGVRPNTQLVSDAGGNVIKGIVVDDFMKTSLPNVYAAGDCAESFDITTGERKILALLPNAYLQGETAGINMAGTEKAFIKAIPMNAAGFFGIHVVTAGSYIGKEVEGGGKENDPTYRKFFVENDMLKGYIIIGDTSRAGIYTSLIRDQISLNSVDFELIKKAPALIAFSKNARAEMLSGGVA
jgi:NAD(P)H-nitrite reductase large subunit